MLFVLTGSSGAGKTTLAHYLRDHYGFRVQRNLPKTPVRAVAKIVVDGNPALRDPGVMMTSGRDLVGHVGLLGGFVVHVSSHALSGTFIRVPNGAREVDAGRLLRTVDILMRALGHRKVSLRSLSGAKRRRAT